MRFSQFLRASVLCALSLALPTLQAQNTGTNAPSADALILTTEGPQVQRMRAGTDAWVPAETNQVLIPKDQVRTGMKSRAAVRLSNQEVIRMKALTTMEIQPPDAQTQRTVLDLKAGAAYFYNREAPGETGFRTPVASGAIRGTEFHLEVGEGNKTVVTLIDGEVELTNNLGGVTLRSGEQGIVEQGQAPRKTAVIDAMSIIQWALFYPAVVPVEELGLPADAQNQFNDSLSAYRSGDLVRAAALFPTNNAPNSGGGGLLNATLMLAVGQVEESQTLLKTLAANGSGEQQRVARALQQMIAIVKGQAKEGIANPTLATEWMVESYYQQSRFDLTKALEAARQAAVKSPAFGFAWERVAELEFSFGRREATLEALNKALELTPRNAQAHALKGFGLAAQNKISEAQEHFDEAIAIDGALGNAWLGRGLTLIRENRAKDGRQALMTAATLEPNRAIIRSYLGKAQANEGIHNLARKELDLAKRLDPNDPTAFLYSALLYQEDNNINRAVEDLEKSKELNDNRRVFRSRLMLDQDRAVRSANLAAIYRDLGMSEFSVWEAGRAVQSDYANYSAHLFLANSFEQRLDPRGLNARYEPAWLSELLLANLLGPVGGGMLSRTVSQQEYGKLFERDRLGFSSLTEYWSRGAWNQIGSQYGTFGNAAYALDFEYRTDPGERPNNDFEQLVFQPKFKQQLTPKDTLYFHVIYSETKAGDVAQYYDQSQAARTFMRIEDQIEPIVFAGYHHEWSPGSHTLALVGRFTDDFEMIQENGVNYLRQPPGLGAAYGLQQINSSLYNSDFEGYTAEAQHIWQSARNNLVVGGKFQTASPEAEATVNPGGAVIPAFSQTVESDLRRYQLYLYDTFKLTDTFSIVGGVSYDELEYPENVDLPPLTSDTEERTQLSPKAGFLWDLTKDTHLRGYYAHSLGGLYFDQSLRLEPAQIAGFNQAYRSIIPESVMGITPGTRFQTMGLGIDHQFPTRTYVGLDALRLTSTGQRTYGIYRLRLAPPPPTGVPFELVEQAEAEERSIIATIHQLIGDEWSIGSRYWLRDTELERAYPQNPGFTAIETNPHSTLHQVNLYAIYNHRCGFFASWDSNWNLQSNRGFANRPGDEFWQHNVWAGWRSPRRRVEARVGLLNIADQDYQLEPLTFYYEMPRERTAYASLKLNF
ncbi:MAG TPA: TonB-dependent receptor [Methylomirabilota bacterium]|nr:TonB-dependent receptor [Methylomirabilota bacterium]